MQFSGSATNKLDHVYYPLPAPSGDIPSAPLAQEKSTAYHRYSSFDLLQPDVRFRRQYASGGVLISRNGSLMACGLAYFPTYLSISEKRFWLGVIGWAIGFLGNGKPP